LILAVVLSAALPLASRAQGGGSFASATCSVRHNSADFDGDCKTDIPTFSLGKAARMVGVRPQPCKKISKVFCSPPVKEIFHAQ